MGGRGCPPENLGNYLEDFTALMKRYDINGLLYGHFGDSWYVRLICRLAQKPGGKSKFPG